MDALQRLIYLLFLASCTCRQFGTLAATSLPDENKETMESSKSLAPWSPSREIERRKLDRLRGGVERQGSSASSQNQPKADGTVPPHAVSTSPAFSSRSTAFITTEMPDATRLLHALDRHEERVSMRVRKWEAMTAIVTIVVVALGAMLAVCVVYSRHLRIARAR